MSLVSVLPTVTGILLGLLSVRLDAPALAAALARCPEAVCRRYLPHGRRQGRY